MRILKLFVLRILLRLYITIKFRLTYDSFPVTGKTVIIKLLYQIADGI